MSKIMAIASAKGGVGKTTVTANLGVALASEFNKNVLLIDGNLTAPNLGYHFGINYPTYNITDIKNKHDAKKAIYAHNSGVKIICGPPNFDSRSNPDILQNVLNAVGDSYDYILIDSGPSLGREALSALNCCDEIICVTSPDVPSVICSARTIGMSRRMKKKSLGIVLNQYQNKKYGLLKEEVQSLCKSKIISTMPYSSDIIKSLAMQDPIVNSKPNHPISIEYKKIAAYILGLRYEPKGLLFRLKQLLGLVKERKPSSSEIAVQKESEKVRMVEDVMKEVLDVDKLRSELSQEIKSELKERIKEELKSKLKEKLKERGL